MSNELQAMIEARNKRQDEIADLVELANSNPGYRLAVVDSLDVPKATYGLRDGGEYRRVVKMEGEC